jgi:phosphohistidine phosphatase
MISREWAWTGARARHDTMDQPSKGRRLLIMRHAKSDWGTPAEPDFDRPLAKRGQRDAPRMGEWLRAQGLVPDLVLASPARRARETASKVCKVLDIAKQAIQWEPRIYDATRADLIEVLADCPADRRLVLLVGHNPGLEELLEYLVRGSGTLPGGDKTLPTAAVASVRLKAVWRKLTAGSGRVEHWMCPKGLGDA